MTRIAELFDVSWRGSPAADSTPHPSLRDGFSVTPWPAALGDALRLQWHALGQAAATPNPFFEEWFLGSSLEQFDPDGQVLLAALVDHGRLVGLMPICRARNYHGRRLPHMAIWQHANSFCGEPLIAPGYAAKYWRNVLDWCDRNARTGLFLHLCNLPKDGTSFTALRDLVAESGRSLAQVKTVSRAALRKGLSPEDHLAQTMDKKRRKELARKRRRLEETGELVFTRAADEAGIDAWIDEFLQLERQGWKGVQGSSLASAPATQTLFRTSLRGAARHGRLERLAFYLDGRPLAMLCNFLAPPLSFAFKTAFDENFSKLSPGMLLQVENLSLLGRGDIELSDSCAAPGHPMIEQIWADRRELALVNIAIGGTLRRGVGAALSGIEMRRAEKVK